jgi:DNA-binding IclR family transcriptional regulator
MPKRPLTPSIADEHAAPGGAAAVDRALSLLDLFREARGSLSLGQLADRSRLYKSTVLRLLASLEHVGFVVHNDDGRYVLGPAVARLHASYMRSFSLESVVMPALRSLADATGESAAYHIRQTDQRVCLYRIDSQHPVRDHIRVGDVMPLDRGAGGRVLLAFGGARGELYERIRRERVAVLVGDRIAQLAGISAPAFDAEGSLVGAVTLTMPSQRLDTDYAPLVVQAATLITERLGGEFPAAPAG